MVVLLSESGHDVKLSTMKNALFLICTLVIFVTGFVSVVHAHVGGQDFGIYAEFSQDINEETDGDDTNVFYNVPGFLVDDSRSFLLTSKIYVSFVYSVRKRPPRI